MSELIIKYDRKIVDVTDMINEQFCVNILNFDIGSKRLP
jgi:hypothetical protein